MVSQTHGLPETRRGRTRHTEAEAGEAGEPEAGRISIDTFQSVLGGADGRKNEEAGSITQNSRGVELEVALFQCDSAICCVIALNRDAKFRWPHCPGTTRPVALCVPHPRHDATELMHAGLSPGAGQREQSLPSPYLDSDRRKTGKSSVRLGADKNAEIEMLKIRPRLHAGKVTRTKMAAPALHGGSSLRTHASDFGRWHSPQHSAQPTAHPSARSAPRQRQNQNQTGISRGDGSGH